MILSGVLGAQASGFGFLTIEKSDGTLLSLPAVGLTITYADGTLTASSDSETATFALSEVSRMYFSDTNNPSDSGEATALSNPSAGSRVRGASPQTAFDLSGRPVAPSATGTVSTAGRKGIYIIKENGKTSKKKIK